MTSAARGMSRGRPAIGHRLLAATALAATVAVAVMALPVSAATVRYASPSGSGTACSSGSPCDVREALEAAPAGTIVDIRGDQGDYALSSDLDAAPGITVRGSHGRPRLLLTDGGLTFQHSKVRQLFISADGSSTALGLNDRSSADRVVAQQSGAGHACYLGHRTSLRNSICRSYGLSDKAVETDGNVTLRNVTAFGGWQTAILAFGRSGCGCPAATLTMVNTIARAGARGKDLLIESEDGVAITVKATYSNFRTKTLVGPVAKRKLVGSPTNQTSANTRPKFIDATTGNLRAAPGSAVIDKGATSKLKNGPKDVDGRPRKAGKRTDIGASEYLPPQTTITSGPSGTTTDDTPTFTFKSSRPGSSFVCKVDGGPWLACTSPSTPSVALGAHTFSVRATDPLGYVDPSPAKRTITVVT